MNAIGVLAAGIAHDFNNILTSIIGHASLLSERNSGNGQYKTSSLDYILKEANRAADLCRQLLSFTRNETENDTIIDLADFISSETEILKRLIGEKIELSISRLETKAPVKIVPAKMYQVLMNLVLNARDAMPNGGRIELWIDATDQRAIFGCSDNGTGISPEIADRIFEPFFTTKEVGKGTGLGLSLCYNIIKEAGGLITLDSAPGQGSTFVIELPLQRLTDYHAQFTSKSNLAPSN
jgi:two-component system cell cycle sensor histidine kinase/response regulator CckA